MIIQRYVKGCSLVRVGVIMIGLRIMSWRSKLFHTSILRVLQLHKVKIELEKCKGKADDERSALAEEVIEMLPSAYSYTGDNVPFT